MENILWIIIGVLGTLLAVSRIIFARKKPSVTESTGPLTVTTEHLQTLGALKSQVEGITNTQESLRTSLTSLETSLKGLETKVVETTGSAKESVLKDLRNL